MIDHSPRNEKLVSKRQHFPGMLMLIGIVALLGALLLMLFSGSAARQDRFDFTLRDVNGQPFTLSDYAGKTIAVNFWATWCPPCRQEMPDLDAYYRAHLQDGNFLLVAVNDGEEPLKARAFIEQNGFSFPVLVDPVSTVTISQGINGLPTTLIIDASGQIVYRHSGIITPDILDSQIALAGG
jgi:thiol-disulfide isomerase/thioredoxin